MAVTPDQILGHGRDLVDSWGRDAQALQAVRYLLIHGTVPAMAGLLAVTIAALLASGPTLLRVMRRISPAAWLGALVIFNGALAARLFWVGHLPQVYFDEVSFLDTAENMARLGLHALSPADGAAPGATFHACPAGWQFLIACCYRVVGADPRAAFNLAAVLSALTVLGVFLAVHAMTDRDAPALLAALFVAALPIHLRVAGSTALETSSAFFLFATLVALVIWIREGGTALLFLTAALGAWLVNLRMEGPVVLVPLLFVFFVLFCPSERLRGWRVRMGVLGAATLGFCFALPGLLADFYGLVTHFYVFYEPTPLLAASVRLHTLSNLTYWISDVIHPRPFTVLAAVGVVMMVWRPPTGRPENRAGCLFPYRRLAGFWLTWWVVLVAFYTANASCDFALRHTIDSWRTALHPALGLLVLAALGADALGSRIPRVDFRVTFLAGVVAMALTIPCLHSAFIQDRHIWMRQWDAQEEMRAQVPPDAWVVVPDELPSGFFPGSGHGSVTAQMAWTMGVRPHFYVFRVDGSPASGAASQVRRDVSLWAQAHTLYLYFVNSGSVEDVHFLAQLRRVVPLRLLLNRSVPHNHFAFALYQIGVPDGRRGEVTP